MDIDEQAEAVLLSPTLFKRLRWMNEVWVYQRDYDIKAYKPLNSKDLGGRPLKKDLTPKVGGAALIIM